MHLYMLSEDQRIRGSEDHWIGGPEGQRTWDQNIRASKDERMRGSEDYRIIGSRRNP
jgi:hypothetical protein